MYKPPFSSFKAPKADPMQPLAARVVPPAPAGQRVHEAPVIRKQGPGQPQATPRIQLIDPNKVRMQQSNIDRRKDMVNTPEITMSSQSHADNKEFVEQAAAPTMHEFHVFPEECTTVFMDKRTGLAYPNVCLIGINGVQYPLFPGNNRAPWFVYEALETHRELRNRYKDKIAPPKSQGRSILFSDPRSRLGGKGQMMTNQQIFTDSMLGRPNYFDTSQDMTANHLIRQHREQALRDKNK